jgi:hypothetical protein
MSDVLADQSLKMTPERLSALFADRGATVPPDVLGHWAELGVPTAPSARLTRRQTAEALKKVGWPVTCSTLNTLSTRGEGPLFDRFGQYAVYEWADALSWAQARATGKRRSSSEGRSQEAAERAKQVAKHARDIRDAMRANAARSGAGKARPKAAEMAPTAGAKARRRNATAELVPAG